MAGTMRQVSRLDISKDGPARKCGNANELICNTIFQLLVLYARSKTTSITPFSASLNFCRSTPFLLRVLAP